MWLIIAGDRGGSHSRPGASSRALFSLVFLLSSAAKQGKNKQGCAARTPTPLPSAPGAHCFPHSAWEYCRAPHCHTMSGCADTERGRSLPRAQDCGSCCSSLVTSSRLARAEPWHSLCWVGVGFEAATPSQGTVSSLWDEAESRTLCKHVGRHHGDGWTEHGASRSPLWQDGRVSHAASCLGTAIPVLHREIGSRDLPAQCP